MLARAPRSSFFASLLATGLLATGCAPPLETGRPCVRNSDCDEPAACVEGRCGSECSLHSDCLLGARCVIVAEGVGRCFVDAADQCGPSVPCPYVGLQCVDDRCYNPCGESCPRDSVCVAGRCLAPPSDAGPRDGGAATIEARVACDERTGAPCAATETCERSHGASAVCRTPCASHADCDAPDLCGRTGTGSMEQCTRACQPITNAGCLSGESCDQLTFQTGGVYSLAWDCRGAGTGGNGDVCDPPTPMTCAAGFTCRSELDGAVCRPMCEVGGAACPSGLTCRAFTEVAPLDGRTYGACVPIL